LFLKETAATMAKFNIYSAFLTFIVVGAAVATADIIKEYKCEGKMSNTCVFEVFDTIFTSGTVTNHCCHELVNIGLVCHNAFVQKALEKPEFKNKDKSVILEKAAQVWNQCAAVAPSPST